MPEAIHTFRHEAMATYFEIRIAGAKSDYAGQAAQAAFAVIERAEALLSRYLESSEISQINQLQPGEVVRVSPEVFDCLEQSLRLQEMTRGAFDPALGAPVAASRGQLLMDRDSLLIGLQGAPVSLDLGAIGKGYGLDLAASELGSWDIGRALLIGGGSSLLALGDSGSAPTPGWEISLGGVSPLRRLVLDNRALGSSGTAVKGEHIIDPRTGQPVPAGHRTWAAAATAAAADALSTAWMVLSPVEIEEICAAHPGIGAIVQSENSGAPLWSCGSLDLENPPGPSKPDRSAP